MPRNRFVSDDRDKKIEQLEEELFLARMAIVDLMPEQLRAVLTANFYCESRELLHEWLRWSVEQIIDAADKRPGHEMGDYPGSGQRAYCPLCGSEASSPYTRGFAFPTGLIRHLEGSHSQQQCSVFRAVERMARDRLRGLEAGGPRIRWSSPRVPPWRVPPPAPTERPAPPTRPSAEIVQLRKE